MLKKNMEHIKCLKYKLKMYFFIFFCFMVNIGVKVANFQHPYELFNIYTLLKSNYVHSTWISHLFDK